MSNLPELLDEAVGHITPSFDHDAIAATVSRRRRVRRRRRASVATASIVVCIAVIWVIAAQPNSSRVRTVSPTVPDPPTSSVVPPASLEQLRHALDAWANFPAHATPRPLVMLSESGNTPIAFDNQTKESFLSGAFNEPASFPNAPATADSYPIITAADTLAALRASGSPGPDPNPTPLTITSIQLDHAGFATDRGNVDLPAWIFTFGGVQGSASILAVAPSARFPLPQRPLGPGNTATLAPDDKTLTVSFTGGAAGTGPCTADYTIDQLASNTAVAINIQEHRHGTGSEACPQVGYFRTATITLDAPLGNRVLVTAPGVAPIAVTRNE